MRKICKKITLLILVITFITIINSNNSNLSVQATTKSKVAENVVPKQANVAQVASNDSDINSTITNNQTEDSNQNSNEIEKENDSQQDNNELKVDNSEDNTATPVEITSVEDLQKVNSGEQPVVYVNDDNTCKYIDGSYTNIKVNSSDDAIKSVDSVSSLIGIEKPSEELKVDNVNSSDELTAYKMQQEYNSVPVYGREVIVSTDKSGKTTSIGGNYIGDINIATTNTISEENAVALATETYGQDANIQSKGLTIYTLDDTKPVLCWQILAQGEKDSKVFSKYVFIDANAGSVVAEKSLLTEGTSVQTKATDVKGNSRNVNVTQLSKSEKTKPWDKTYELKDSVRNIEIDDANNWKYWLYKPSSIIGSDNNVWSDKVAISAMANLEDTYDYYYNILGRRSIDNKGAKIVASVHYYNMIGGLDNAFWDSANSQFVFGDGSTMCTPLAGGKDVIAHEFTHGVVEYTAGLIYDGESGALNESYADIMGNIIEGDNDPKWLIGEDVMKNGVIAIRSMSDPESLKQPSRVGGQYYVDPTKTSDDNGGVHTNSGILNHAAYLMWKNGIKDKQTLSKLFYNSLLLMGSDSKFEDSRIAVEIAAKNLKLSNAQIKIIDNAFDQVGISAKQLNSAS